MQLCKLSLALSCCIFSLTLTQEGNKIYMKKICLSMNLSSRLSLVKEFSNINKTLISLNFSLCKGKGFKFQVIEVGRYCISQSRFFASSVTSVAETKTNCNAGINM